jgi:CheY-like chemotaxis protein
VIEKARILLVDDSPTDVKLVQMAARKTRWIDEVRAVGDGVEALELLRSEEALRWRPHLILVDINMPRMNGFELLETLKTDPRFRSIPTVILSTSASPDDVSNAYDLHANCYISKPHDFHDFVKTLQVLEEFWLRVATLPDIARLKR